MWYNVGMTDTTNPAANDAIAEAMGRLDLGRMEAAAIWAARQLDTRGVARVALAPGDMTLYCFTIVAPSVPTLDQDGVHLVTIQKDYEVTLATSFGATYAWAANATVHPTYAAEKWANDGNLHTGVVVAVFLNYVWANLTF